MAVSESRKKANLKWDSANLDRMSLALPKGSRDRVKAFAESQGESINGFIKRAIDEAMSRDSGVSADSINALDVEQVNAHIKKTGETVSEFIARAVKNQIDRDKTSLSCGLKVL